MLWLRFHTDDPTNKRQKTDRTAAGKQEQEPRCSIDQQWKTMLDDHDRTVRVTI